MGRRCGRSNPRHMARMPSHHPCSWHWESSLTSFPSRARGQQQNLCQCHPAGLAPYGDDGNGERNQKRRGPATCQPKEGHMGQGAKNITTDKQVLHVLSNNKHPKNSHTHTIPGCAVCSPLHVNTSTEDSCSARELKKQFVGG